MNAVMSREIECIKHTVDVGASFIDAPTLQWPLQPLWRYTVNEGIFPRYNFLNLLIFYTCTRTNCNILAYSSDNDVSLFEKSLNDL